MGFSAYLSEHQRGAVQVSLQGRLDSNTAPELGKAVTGLIASPPTRIIFQMEGLEYISSAGLRVIFQVQKAVKSVDGQVLMVNLTPQVRKVFEIINILPSVRVFQNYDEMDEYLDVMQRREIEKHGGGE